MSSGGGGGVVEGRGGFRGVGFGGETGGGLRGGAADGVSGGVKDNSGLFANRPRGFGLETPSLRDMKAKQGAIVSKFMTFFQRKYSLVVEMYQSSFYRQKPNWDRIAEFVYSDLCTTEDLRKEVKDVQFHPVKMLLFVKFSEEMWRDVVVEKLQSTEGVTWTEYGVRVKGYSLDAEVKFIRLLGVSPETGEEEIKETFLELGIGEVIEFKMGWVDAKRVPGVTNGIRTLRVKCWIQIKLFLPIYTGGMRESYGPSILRVESSAVGSVGAATTLETNAESIQELLMKCLMVVLQMNTLRSQHGQQWSGLARETVSRVERRPGRWK